MSPLPSSASADAWKAFVLSRFGPPDDTRSATRRLTSTRTAQMDHELEILQHPEMIALAKKQRNRTLPCCSTPPEVLSRVFWYAQAGWSPERTFPDGDVSLGWIVLTHVCSQWRQVALSSSSLWSDINCYALPVNAVPILIERSRQMKYKLIFANSPNLDTSMESKMSTLRQIWMSQPLRQHTRELVIRDIVTRWPSRAWASFLRNPMSALESLQIVLHARGQQINIVLPDDFMGSTPIPSGLHTIDLANCSLPWTSPLFGAHMRVLKLTSTIRPNEEITLHPSVTQFHSALSRMSNLKSLSLCNVFPVFPDGGSFVSELPASLEALSITANASYMVPSALQTLLSVTLPCHTRCEVEIHKAVEAPLMTEALSHLFLSPPSPRELHIAAHTMVGLSLEESVFGDPQSGLRWIDKSVRHSTERRFTVSFCNEDEIPGEHHLSLLPLFPTDTLERLAVDGNAMEYFHDVEIWRAAFVAANRVSCIALPYIPGIYHLLCALTEIATQSDGEGFILFPRLKVVTIYRDVHGTKNPVEAYDIETAQLRLGLLSLLLARQRTGSPLEELRVEDGILGPEERQRISEITTLYVF